MSLSSSQILSNFKLFSKADNVNSIIFHDLSTYYKLIFVFFVVVTCVFIYFKRTELLSIIGGGSGDLSEFMGKIWINSHLTSADELASTYVPKDFFGNSV